MRVAVLGGGRSSEHDVSLASSAAVRAGLAEASHDVVDVRIARDGTWSCGGEPVALEPAKGVLAADVVFPVLHGPFGEDGTVQGLLELLDVAYVGAGVLASALCMDKVLFKDLMAAHGVPQVDYVALREPGPVDIGWPVFVKPARLGSSVGISKVEGPDALAPALAAAFEHDPLVIVEAMSHGLELECAVMGDDEPVASEPGEIVINADWYDYEAKYTPGGMELVVPARVSDAAREEVRRLALEVFRLSGCSGLARADFFVEDDGRVLVNELNTMPGFTETSVFPKLFEASGVAFPDLVDRLVRLGAERHARESRYRF
jgi:D-alanine-D-alanine ligase